MYSPAFINDTILHVRWLDTIINPFTNQLSFKYKLTTSGDVRIDVIDINGRLVQSIAEGKKNAGEYTVSWNGNRVATGTYFGRISVNGNNVQSVILTKIN